MTNTAKIIDFPSPPQSGGEPDPKHASASVNYIDPIESLGAEIYASSREFAINANILSENAWDLQHLQKKACTRLEGLKRTFDPENSLADSELITQIQKAQEWRIQFSDEVAREWHLRDQLADSLPENPGDHTASNVVVLAAIGVLTLSNGATIQPLFAQEFLSKPAFGWIISLGFGFLLAAVVVHALLSVDETKGGDK
jgi:hypothetical protein